MRRKNYVMKTLNFSTMKTLEKNQKFLSRLEQEEKDVFALPEIVNEGKSDVIIKLYNSLDLGYLSG